MTPLTPSERMAGFRVLSLADAEAMLPHVGPTVWNPLDKPTH